MHTTTRLHTLLLGFRDESGAEMCSVWSLDFGTRVDVGRPSTLTAEEMVMGSEAQVAAESRRLEATVPAGYAVTADFDSEEAAKEAQQKFDQLVAEIAKAVTEPESESE